MRRVISISVAFILGLTAGIFVMFQLDKNACDASLLPLLHNGPTLSLTKNKEVFDLFRSMHYPGYVVDSDIIDQFDYSPRLISLRKTGLIYFTYRLHGERHEVGVSACGQIESVSMKTPTKITPRN